MYLVFTHSNATEGPYLAKKHMGAKVDSQLYWMHIGAFVNFYLGLFYLTIHNTYGCLSRYMAGLLKLKHVSLFCRFMSYCLLGIR